jgi:hypothetical protein
MQIRNATSAGFSLLQRIAFCVGLNRNHRLLRSSCVPSRVRHGSVQRSEPLYTQFPILGRMYLRMNPEHPPFGLWRVACAALLALLFWIGLVGTSQAQSPGQVDFLLFLPADNSNITVDTHLATVRLDASGAGTAVQLDATYRLRSSNTSPMVVTARLAPGGGGSAVQIVPSAAIELTADGQPLAFYQTDDGNYSTQVQVAAGGRVTVRMRYTVQTGEAGLASLRYSAGALNRWPGEISFRLDLAVATALSQESWTLLQPSGWNYAVTSEADRVTIRWLYDVRVPDEPFTLQFIQPGVWAQIRQAEVAISAGTATGETYAKLADIYRQLANTAATEAGRSRFYAQAIAAYVYGIESLAGSADVAVLHRGLADLYRGRVVSSAGTPEANGYVNLMVEQVSAALALLPAGDSSRRELLHWQSDGLQMLLQEARSQRNWQRALVILEQLDQMPDEAVDRSFLAVERREVMIQQALVLMEQGDRDTAMAIAGTEISSAELAPPAGSRVLFTSWQITASVSNAGITVAMTAPAAPNREAEAERALKDLVGLWESSLPTRGSNGYQFLLRGPEVTNGEAMNPWELHVVIPPAADGYLLAQLAPPGEHWAMLRLFLNQLRPEIDQNSTLLWQQVEMRLPLDLRGAGEQWRAMALALDQQADEADAKASVSIGSASAALEGRIQAVTYRSAAEEWRNLARSSWLLFTFRVDREEAAAVQPEQTERSWYLTVDTPPQVLTMQAQVLSITRTLATVLFTLLGLFGLAGILWWLL